MLNKATILKVCVATVGLVVASQVSYANVWMDEDFEGAAAFVQGTTLDPYSANANTAPVSAVLTNTGAVVTSKSFQGLKSYELEPGETLAVGEPYQDQANGNFQSFQFAVNVDPIPAAGTVGTFRWNFDSNNGVAPTTEYSYYVRLVSTGTAVNVIAGEDVFNVVPSESTITTLTSNTDWKFITVLMQKDGVAHADSRTTGPTGVSINQGVHFFVQSNTESSAIGFLGSTPVDFKARDWSFTVNSGKVYLDNLYWDGGLEDNFTDSTRDPFVPAPGSAVSGWSLYD
ncbi:MAG: hypothetical protein ABI579_04335 [Candidatus Sumerlaeota bacterium]